LVTLRAYVVYLVFLVTINYIVVSLLNIVRLAVLFTFALRLESQQKLALIQKQDFVGELFDLDTEAAHD
jgi:ABC-type protease/lipase transport system fused ATPase/permease subunit